LRPEKIDPQVTATDGFLPIRRKFSLKPFHLRAPKL